MTTTKQLADNISEADWQRTLIALLKTYGYRVAHFRGAWSQDGKRYMTPVQAEGKGFPDLVAAREPLKSLFSESGTPPFRTGRLIFLEVKTRMGKLDVEQEIWRQVLIGAGAEYILAHPQDYERLVEGLR